MRHNITALLMSGFLICSLVPQTLLAAEVPEQEISVERTYSEAASYSYTKSFTDPKQDTVGGVAYATINAKAQEIIGINEGNDATVVADDNGALSIGRMQWHGARALELLRMIISEDNQAAYDILGDTLYAEITKNATSWTSRTLSSSEAALIKSLLSTEISTEVQEKLAESDVNIYINHGISLGCTNPAALVYFSDVENQSGSGGSAVAYNRAANIAGDKTSVTLNELHLGTVCYALSGPSTYLSTASGQKTYIKRRRATYGFAVELGWNYCASGDYCIPYDDDAETGASWVQKFLNTYQNAGLALTGVYDSATKAAVKVFQTERGLDADGESGYDTFVQYVKAGYYALAMGTSTEIGASSDSTASSFTGIKYDSTAKVYKYYENGIQATSVTTVAKYNGNWYYVKKGVVDPTYTGFAENSYGWWYVIKGKVSLKQNSIFKGTVNGESGWWYVVNSKVVFTDTVAKRASNKTWWYIKNGRVDFTKTGVVKRAENKTWWYVKNGQVDFTCTDVVQRTENKTWWYVKNGQVDFTCTSVEQRKENKTWWYVKNGQVDFTCTGVVKRAENKTWWYVKNGKVDFTYTGIATRTENSTRWYVKNGQVDFTYNGVVKSEIDGIWWKITNGKVDTSYTGIAENDKGTWYIEKGQVNFSYSGNVTAGDMIYSVTKGKVDTSSTLKVLSKTTSGTDSSDAVNDAADGADSSDAVKDTADGTEVSGDETTESGDVSAEE